MFLMNLKSTFFVLVVALSVTNTFGETVDDIIKDNRKIDTEEKSYALGCSSKSQGEVQRYSELLVKHINLLQRYDKNLAPKSCKEMKNYQMEKKASSEDCAIYNYSLMIKDMFSAKKDEAAKVCKEISRCKIQIYGQIVPCLLDYQVSKMPNLKTKELN